jgi:hypothetical protein
MSASLQGTLTPQGLLSAAEAEQKRLEVEQAARAASLSQGAGEAAGAFQQAAAAPMPQLNPMAALIQSLGGNVASIIGETPRYAQNAQADLSAQKDELLAKRAQNLAALKDNYDRQAMAAASAGDLLAEAKLRKSAESVSKAWQAIHDEAAFKQASSLQGQQDAAAMEREKAGNASRERIAAMGSGGSGGGANSETPENLDLLVDAVQSGNQEPPSTTALYRTKGGRQFLARMQKRGVNMAKLRTDWLGTQQYYRTQNTRPFVMLRTQMDNASQLFDQYEQMSDRLVELFPDYKQTGLNKLMQTLQTQGLGSTEAAQTIQAMQTMSAGLKSEMANVYMGGGVPTDHAMRLAENFVNPTLSHERRQAQIAIGRFEIGVRKNALASAGVMKVEAPPVTPDPQGKALAMTAARKGDRKKFMQLLTEYPSIDGDPDIYAAGQRLIGGSK